MNVLLRPRQDKYLLRGYPWVFRDNIHRAEGEPRTGDAVRILTATGECLGQGLYHESSIIAVRFVTSDPDVELDPVLEERLRGAVAFRNQCLGEQVHARLVNGEADGIPGTFVDRYADVLAFSTICAGIERRRERLLDVLEECCRPRAIVERNDHWLRAKDGLAESRSVLRGRLEGPVTIEEAGLRLEVDVLEGPKTGFFLDQRFHREAIRRLARGRNVLDAFCADGGFALHAAAAGATSVLAVDRSAAALDRARRNAERNRLADRVRFEQADLLEALGEMVTAGRTFDLIVLDPPAFARSKRHRESAGRAYQRINTSAFKLLPPGGLLATSSCSTALSEKDFWEIVRYSARKAGCATRLLYRGFQPLDHPVLPSMPETHYLKFFVLQRLRDELPGTRGDARAEPPEPGSGARGERHPRQEPR